MIPLILRQVQTEISLGGQLQEVLNNFWKKRILMEPSEHMEKFASIITDVWNHTRMVQNRGHKPYEMVIKSKDVEYSKEKHSKGLSEYLPLRKR